MNGILFIDTETTGLLQWKVPLDHPTQPHVVQFAAILADEHGNAMASAYSLIRPDGWVINPDAQAIHGISTEDCERFGIPIVAGLDVLFHMASCAKIVVAHNMYFDSKVIDLASIRADRNKPWRAEHKLFCTMMAATDVCKLPVRYGYKWPTLTEAHQHFFGCAAEDAHDALGDVRTCMKIYFALQQQNAPEIPTEEKASVQS